jgi:glycerol-1-phosphate dehydrogenase [NAD(P)+]
MQKFSLQNTDILADKFKNLTLPLDIFISNELTDKILDFLDNKFAAKKLLLISDHNIISELPLKLKQALQAREDYKELILVANPLKADSENVEQIIKHAKNTDLIIAFGSGTINDLCKYASYNLNIDYIVIASAPSMNGYISSNASITINNFKKSLAAKFPIAAFFDLNILAKAPLKLIQAGLGDSLARSTAQADWKLSHLLLDTEYDPLPFELLQESEKSLLQNAAKLPARDPQAILSLTINLILSGFGMYLSSGSYPASQAEHLISHLYNMLDSNNPQHNLHGEEIAVTSYYMAKLQENILSQDAAPLIKEKFPKARFFKKVFPEFAPDAYKEYSKKNELIKMQNNLQQRLEDNWENIKTEIRSDFLASWNIKEIYEAAGGSIEIASLNWSAEQFEFSCKNAYLIRNRFTFLDLLARE